MGSPENNKMKSAPFFLCLFLCLFFLLPACRDDKGENDYSGVGKLISERNRARHEIAKSSSQKNSSSKKTTANETNTVKSESTSKKKEILSIVLYEEDVEVVASKSGRTLAKGVAYINKKGQIVKIKILRE